MYRLNNFPKNKAVPWVLWAALLLSQLILGVVGFFWIHKNSAGGMSFEPRSLLLPMGVVAGLASLSSLFINLILIQPEKVRYWAQECRAKGEGADQAAQSLLQHYIPKMIVASALSESVTIFGFILFFLRQISPLYFIAFVAAGVILHLIGFPKLGLIDEALRQEYPEAIPAVH